MKKIFVSLFILAASLNAMATDFAVATLTLNGNTSLEQGEVTLVKTDDPAASSFCAPLYINQYDVVIYAINGSEKYQIWANADLTNFPLGIKTYSDASYTITVSNVSGSETLSLYDVVADQTIALTEGQTYPFTAATNSFINDRFIINYVAPTYDASVTTGQDGWASFAFGDNLELVTPAGLTIYKGAYNGNLENPEIALTAIGSKIPANTGVFVKGEANTTYYFNVTASADAVEDNDIVGCVDATPVSTFSGKDIYTLRYANGETALWHYTGTDNIPAGKAVLPISAGGPSAAPKRVRLVINGTTGIENAVVSEKAEKIMENGQVLIKRGDVLYNLQGQIVK